MVERPRFELIAVDGAARRGRLRTRHGSVDTPAFMPVATRGAVRGIEPRELRALGAQILLANAYHLHERPGEAVVAELGGLHGFTGWSGPWLTDSGGFQVTSLADRVEVREEGVAFRSPRDGCARLFTPEAAVAIQEALGADLIVVLDECRPLAWLQQEAAGSGSLRARHATERTARWAERALRRRRRPDQALFAVVQGGADTGLRRWCAKRLRELGFDGYAHGGLGLGESAPRRQELIAATHAELPPDAPRYAMGIGTPGDLLEAVALGVDLFDCVLPTRNGRHGIAFTRAGPLRLRAARYRNDPRPLDEGCDCPTCRHHARAYLHHLLRERELLGGRLVAVHNLRFYLALLERARTAIEAGSFAELRRELGAAWTPSG